MFDLDKFLSFLNKNKNNSNYILEILNIYYHGIYNDKIKEYYCYPMQQLYIIIDTFNQVHYFYRKNNEWHHYIYND